MVLYGSDVLYLYIGRIFAGATGGGMYICLPLFVAEIADQRLVFDRFTVTSLPQNFVHSFVAVMSMEDAIINRCHDDHTF